ncbi:hypothetical protein FHR71_005631 [Methylobacterium sp. RAS18]|nr:hypothetical protein [Methylobacterium sp. RAS18]
MSPEAKEVLDYLVALMGTGSVGGIILAFFGWMKARAEKPHIADKPSVGATGLAQIGGMVMGQQDLRDLIEAMRGISASHDRCTLVRETEMEAQKRLAKERREHENDAARERRDHETQIARDRHEDWRVMADLMRTLNDRLRDFRVST